MQRVLLKSLQKRSALVTRTPMQMAMRTFASGTTFEQFNFEDPFKLDQLLNDDERAIYEAAKQFSQERLMPRVREAYNNEQFDLEIMKEMGEQGFLGCTIPDYDLPGVSSTAYGKCNRIFLLTKKVFFRSDQQSGRVCR